MSASVTGGRTFLELAGKILDEDAQVFLAYDAQQAFQLAKHFGLSVALIDLDVKGRDGLALLQNLREQFPALPVIVISRVLGVQ